MSERPHDLHPSWYALLLEEAQSRTPGLPDDPVAVAHKIASSVVRLSDGLTRDRALPGSRYMDRTELSLAYLLYYLPANAWRARVLLRGAVARGWLPLEGTLKVADQGCGQGTLLWALLDALAQARGASEALLRLQFRGVDHSVHALETTASLARKVGHHPVLAPGISLKTQLVRESLSRPGALPDPGQDLILMGYVLNELFNQEPDPVQARLDWVSQHLERLRPGGLLLILEPGLQSTARGLGALRDRLVEGQLAQVLSPCTHGSSCPVVGEEKPSREWCHQEVSWHRPRLVQTVDSLTGLSKDRLACSHLLLRRPEEALAEEMRSAAEGLERFRALSPALRGRGTVTVYLCGQEGLQETVLLTRHGSESNEPFREVRRGDEVLVGVRTVKGGQLRLEEDSEVAVHRLDPS